MMRCYQVWQLAGYLLSLSFGFNVVAAQESLPIPLAATAVFSPSERVEVVETLPLYIADQKQVHFYDYDQQEWHTYFYPDFPLAADEIATPNFTENADGTYTLKVDYYTSCNECEIDESAIDFTPPRAAFVRERWHFDPQHGGFRPFEAICGGHAHALPGAEEWVVNASAAGEFYLCNTETGQSSQPLAGIRSISTPALLQSAAVSPDSRWLVFTFAYDFSVWVYDFAENTLNLVGTMAADSPFTNRDFPKVGWIDNKKIVVENRIENYGDSHFYLYRADLSQPNSLEAVYDSHQPINKQENPWRYTWIGDAASDTATLTPSEACTTYKYNPVDNILTSFQIPGVCSFGAIIPDGSDDRLALSYPFQSHESQKLVRFNPDTGKYENFSVGNYQGLAGISPDGRYVVFTVDSGQYNYQMAVLDLQTGSLLEPFQTINNQFADIDWLGNRTFWQNTSNGKGIHSRLFTITDNGVSIQTGKFYPPSIGAAPDNRYLLMESSSGTLDILNVETLEMTTIAQAPDGVMIYGVWEDNGLITVTVWKDNYYLGRLGNWRVRVHI